MQEKTWGCASMDVGTSAKQCMSSLQANAEPHRKAHQ